MLVKVIAKLLLLVSVLLMPLGMSGAAAAAHGPHDAARVMTMRHCPDNSPSHHQKNGIAECTMACAGALPAVNAVREQTSVHAKKSVQPTIALKLHGLHPETATPPPKAS